jgi:hypothetical protein
MPPRAKELLSTQLRDRAKLPEHDDIEDLPAPFGILGL